MIKITFIYINRFNSSLKKINSSNKTPVWVYLEKIFLWGNNREEKLFFKIFKNIDFWVGVFKRKKKRRNFHTKNENPTFDDIGMSSNMPVSCESNESISNNWHGKCGLATIRRFSIEVVRLFPAKNGHEHVHEQGHEIASRTRWVCIQNERGRRQTAHERRTRLLVLKNGLIVKLHINTKKTINN